MHITSDGSVFGNPPPELIAETHELQGLFNTKMLSIQVADGRTRLAIRFHTRTHMPTVYMTAGTYPGLTNIEVLTPHLVIVSIPYRSGEDVDAFRKHFQPVWQMTRSQ